MSSHAGRRRSNVRQYSAEDQALTQISKEAENRLAAKRAARAEAREIRMKEIERQQREQEEKLNNENTGVPKARQHPAGSRRGSDDSSEGSGDAPSSKDRDLRMELRALEEKYKAAMMSSAQLDNEKQSLVYQVELLKDQLEEQAESYVELQREHKDKCRDLEMTKRELQAVQMELKALREANDCKDRLIAESGLMIVAAENGELALERTSESPSTNGPIPTGAVLLSAEAMDLLNKSSQGSLGMHCLASHESGITYRTPSCSVSTAQQLGSKEPLAEGMPSRVVGDGVSMVQAASADTLVPNVDTPDSFSFDSKGGDDSQAEPPSDGGLIEHSISFPGSQSETVKTVEIGHNEKEVISDWSESQLAVKTISHDVSETSTENADLKPADRIDAEQAHCQTAAVEADRIDAEQAHCQTAAVAAATRAQGGQGLLAALVPPGAELGESSADDKLSVACHQWGSHLSGSEKDSIYHLSTNNSGDWTSSQTDIVCDTAVPPDASLEVSKTIDLPKSSSVWDTCPDKPSLVVTTCSHSQQTSSDVTESEDDGEEFFDAVSTPLPSPCHVSGGSQVKELDLLKSLRGNVKNTKSNLEEENLDGISDDIMEETGNCSEDRGGQCEDSAYSIGADHNEEQSAVEVDKQEVERELGEARGLVKEVEDGHREGQECTKEQVTEGNGEVTTDAAVVEDEVIKATEQEMGALQEQACPKETEDGKYLVRQALLVEGTDASPKGASQRENAAFVVCSEGKPLPEHIETEKEDTTGSNVDTAILTVNAVEESVISVEDGGEHTTSERSSEAENIVCIENTAVGAMFSDNKNKVESDTSEASEDGASLIDINEGENAVSEMGGSEKKFPSDIIEEEKALSVDVNSSETKVSSDVSHDDNSESVDGCEIAPGVNDGENGSVERSEEEAKRLEGISKGNGRLLKNMVADTSVTAEDAMADRCKREEQSNNEEISPGDSEEISPNEGGQISPCDEEISPSEGGEISPSDGGEISPSDGGEISPSEGGEISPSDGREISPSDGREISPSDGGEILPSDGRQISPCDREILPSEGGEISPSEGEMSPSDDGEMSSSKGADGKEQVSEKPEAVTTCNVNVDEGLGKGSDIAAGSVKNNEHLDEVGLTAGSEEKNNTGLDQNKSGPLDGIGRTIEVSSFEDEESSGSVPPEASKAYVSRTVEASSCGDDRESFSSVPQETMEACVVNTVEVSSCGDKGESSSSVPQETTEAYVVNTVEASSCGDEGESSSSVPQETTEAYVVNTVEASSCGDEAQLCTLIPQETTDACMDVPVENASLLMFLKEEPNLLVSPDNAHDRDSSASAALVDLPSAEGSTSQDCATSAQGNSNNFEKISASDAESIARSSDLELGKESNAIGGLNKEDSSAQETAPEDAVLTEEKINVIDSVQVDEAKSQDHSDGGASESSEAVLDDVYDFDDIDEVLDDDGKMVKLSANTKEMAMHQETGAKEDVASIVSKDSGLPESFADKDANTASKDDLSSVASQELYVIQVSPSPEVEDSASSYSQDSESRKSFLDAEGSRISGSVSMDSLDLEAKLDRLASGTHDLDKKQEDVSAKGKDQHGSHKKSKKFKFFNKLFK